MADSSCLLFKSTAHMILVASQKGGNRISQPSPVALSSTRARLARPRWPCMEHQLAASEGHQFDLLRLS